MTQRKITQNPMVIAMVLWLAGCASTATGVGEQTAAIAVECAAPTASQPVNWVCSAPTTVDCGAAPVLVVQSPQGQACVASDLTASPTGLSGGPNTVVVRNASGAAVCSTQITVRDTAPPTLQTHTLQLWPPNHKFHDIAVEDCVSAVDACDGALQGEFIWASSDEPIDDLGDGHFAPDIALSADCLRVSVRSERQGPKDGRVYKLGVRVVDRSGNASEGECQVIVDHDQRGVVGADSGEKYRVTFNGANGGPSCDGTPPPPVMPPVNPPPVPPTNPPTNPPTIPPTTPPTTPPMTPPPPATPIPDFPQ
jgi:hypothetical protein